MKVQSLFAQIALSLAFVLGAFALIASLSLVAMANEGGTFPSSHWVCDKTGHTVRIHSNSAAFLYQEFLTQGQAANYDRIGEAFMRYNESPLTQSYIFGTTAPYINTQWPYGVEMRGPKIIANLLLEESRQLGHVVAQLIFENGRMSGVSNVVSMKTTYKTLPGNDPYHPNTQAIDEICNYRYVAAPPMIGHDPHAN